MAPARFERATCRLGGNCSIQLNYGAVTTGKDSKSAAQLGRVGLSSSFGTTQCPVRIGWAKWLVSLIPYLPILSWAMPMGHTVRGKSKLLARVRRIRGQVEALERALEAEKSCSVILHQIAAVRGAINGLMSNVLEDHIQTHVANPAIEAAERAQGADELIDVIRTYLK